MAKIIVNNPRQVINGGAKKYYFKVKGLGGPKGDKGDKGDTGSRGPQGEPGNAATVYVGSTTTLPVGQDATVENVGTQYNAVLNFGIPQGPRGPQGVKGDPGEPGQKGEPGPRGIQGERGTNATVYIGTTSTLNPGTQATVYNSGTENNAVLNFGIPRGEKGETGATGATGATGPAGQNFTPTIVDSLPATGNQSNLYLTPKNYTTGTATGNPITISLGEDAGQISSAQLDGNTTQQTYTGKNLYQSIAVTEPNFGIASEVLPDGRVRIYGKATSNSSNFLGYMATNLPAGTYTFSITGELPFRLLLRSDDNQNHWVLNAGQTKVTQTISSTLNTIWVWGYQLVSGTDYDITIGIQLEAGSEASSFEPYVGGVASPNPDYPQAVNTVTGTQTVEVVGKNLYKLDTGTYNTLVITKNSEGGYVLNGTPTANVQLSIAIPEISQEHTLSFTASGTSSHVYVRTRDAGGVLQDNLPLTQTSGSVTSSKTIATSSLTVTTGETFTNFTIYPQLELGSTATDYASYSKQTFPIDLGSIELCKLGDYQDYIYKSGNDWKVHKAVGELVVNGSETGWIITASTGSPNYYYARTNAKDGISVSNYYGGYCNNFTNRGTYIQASDVVNTDVFSLGSPSYSLRMLILGSRLSAMNTEALSTWLSANTPTIYYALATATDTTITDQTLIAQLEAVRNATLQASNTITNTATGTNLAGDLELGYCEYDPHNRYNKWLWLDINNNYEQLGN